MKKSGKRQNNDKISTIIENDIKYLNGTTIFFDGGKSKSIF